VRRLRPRWSRFIPSSAPERGPLHLGAGTLVVGEAEAREALAESDELGLGVGVLDCRLSPGSRSADEAASWQLDLVRQLSLLEVPSARFYQEIDLAPEDAAPIGAHADDFHALAESFAHHTDRLQEVRVVADDDRSLV